MAIKEYQEEELQEEVIHLKPRITQQKVPQQGVVNIGEEYAHTFLKEPEQVKKPVDEYKVSEEGKNKYRFQPVLNQPETLNYVRMNDLHSAALGGRQVFLVSSTKGGVGKTTVTLNMANVLQNTTKGRVVVVDLMQPHGNITTRLLLKSLVNVKTWERYMLENINLTDRQIFDDLVIKDPRKGFYLVPGIQPPETISLELVEYIVRNLSQVFDFVIIDVGPEDQEILIKSISMANKVFLVVDYDIATIHDSQQYIQQWYKRKVNVDKINILVNFEPNKKEKNRLNKQSCAHYFNGLNIAGFLPDTAGMRGLHNEGKLITEVQPKGAFTKELKEVLSQFISDVEPQRLGLFSRLFKGGR